MNLYNKFIFLKKGKREHCMAKSETYTHTHKEVQNIMTNMWDKKQIET